MRKLTITLIAIALSHSLVVACLCQKKIEDAFDGVKDYVIDDLYKPHKEKVEDLTDEVKTNIEKIDTQNEELEKLIKIEKEKALQYENMVFLLKQRLKMLE